MQYLYISNMLFLDSSSNSLKTFKTSIWFFAFSISLSPSTIIFLKAYFFFVLYSWTKYIFAYEPLPINFINLNAFIFKSSVIVIDFDFSSS